MAKETKTMQIGGNIYKIPASAIAMGPDGKPFIHLRANDAAAIIKQFVKKTFPNIMVWANSNKYAGGDSVRIYISNPDGSKVEHSVWKLINEFGKTFQEGNFNGMNDSYEYRDDSVYTDYGHQIRGGTNYMFVENQPVWGSPQYVKNMIVGYMAGEYVGGPVDLQTAMDICIEKYKIKPTTVQKAVELIKC